MLKNVKSFYILRIIFSFLNEKQKLKIIKYNKNLQQNINISLINYKVFSNKIIIYEQNGKGKECFEGNLIYEGEYLNGERNGKGKEYRNDNLEYEGEYLNGKRHGQGIEYKEKEIIFNGEYLNGLRHGKGLEYYIIKKKKSCELIFEGNYKDGKKCDGYGKEYDLNGKLIYEGEYKNLKKFNGKEYNNDEKVIEYKNGRIWNGKGKEYNDNGDIIYEGEYLNGKRNGQGKEYDEDKNIIFEGSYKDGKRYNGKSFIYLNNIKFLFEDIVIGLVLNNYYNIKKIDDNNQEIDDYDYYNGKGKEYNNDKLLFEGKYLNGKRHGKGKEYNDNGELKFEVYIYMFLK